MTPEQTRFLLGFVKQLHSCVERCAATGRPAQKQAGRKITSEKELISLSIVAEPDEDFPAPIATHGAKSTHGAG